MKSADRGAQHDGSPVRAAAARQPMAGFTLIELMITLALVGLLAWVSLPLYEVASIRARESDLREALRIIRGGLDAYKAAVDSGILPRTAGESGYPPSLDVLTEPLEVAASGNVLPDEHPRRLVILRRLPRDPFAPDPTVPAAQTWTLRAYASRADDPQPGSDVFDVSSRSTRTALDGTAYSSW